MAPAQASLLAKLDTQERVRDFLTNAVAGGRASHAYLFLGAPGAGKLDAAWHICNTWVLRIKIKDTQGGMKGFSQAGQAIFLTTRINSFLFDTEFIYKASRRKEINLRTINANIKEGLAVSDMGFKVLRREALNFLSILFHRD